MADNIVAFPRHNNETLSSRIVPSRIRDARLAQQLNQSELAALIGVSRQAMSAYELGDKNPNPDVLIKISKELSQPISYFTAEERPVFGDFSTRFFRSFGVSTKSRNAMCTVMGKWFVQTARYFFDYVNFPEVSISPTSPSGMRYTDDEIEDIAEECRHSWGLGYGPISNVLGLLESKGIVVCRYEFEGDKVEAFSFWNGSRPFIFLASDKKSAARARFDAAHELGHLILHRWVGAEEIEDPKILKIIEKEANRFAGAFLLPRKTFPSEVFSPRLDAFVNLKRRWKIAIQAMIYRCKDLEIFDDDQVTNLYKQISYRKWRTEEPLDDILSLENPILLKRAAELLIKSNKKSPDQILAELQINYKFLIKACGLSSDFFDNKNAFEFSPTLKK